MPNEPGPKRKLSSAKISEHRKPMHEALLVDAATNQRVYDAVETELGRIACEHYSGMADYWQSEQFRELTDLISRTASNFCIKLSNVDYHATQSNYRNGQNIHFQRRSL